MRRNSKKLKHRRNKVAPGIIFLVSSTEYFSNFKEVLKSAFSVRRKQFSLKKYFSNVCVAFVHCCIFLARLFDFFDSGVMERLRHQLINSQVTQNRVGVSCITNDLIVRSQVN